MQKCKVLIHVNFLSNVFYQCIHISGSMGMFFFQDPAPAIMVLKTLLAVQMEPQYVNTALISNSWFRVQRNVLHIEQPFVFLSCKLLVCSLALSCARGIFLKSFVLHKRLVSLFNLICDYTLVFSCKGILLYFILCVSTVNPFFYFSAVIPS